MYYILSMSVHNNLYAKRIKVSEVYADNNGDNSSLLMDDGEVVFKTDGYMEINSGSLLHLRGNQSISLITPSVQTSQTVFNQDNHVVNKKFVDDTVAPINTSITQLEQKDNTHSQQIATLNDKTQNISGTTTETKIEDDLVIEKANIGYSDVSENNYITRLGNNSTLLKSPTQEGGIDYTNDILTLGGTPMSGIYGANDTDASGWRVAISNDGNIIASMSLNGDNTAQGETDNGACIIYQNVNGVYTQLGQVLYGDDTADQLQRVSLSSDGFTVAVGSFKNDGNTGNVRVYRYNGSLWVQLGNEIVGENPADEHGTSISLSSDGETIITGANRADPNGVNSAGHARVFQYDGTNWTQLGGNIEGTGEYYNAGLSVSINGAGDRIIVAVPYTNIGGVDNVGTGKIYDLFNGNWVFNTQINGTVANDILGVTVKMSQDGKTVVLATYVGLFDRGYAEVYRATDGFNWVQLGQQIIGEANNDKMTLENSMSLSKDGNTLALGAYLNDGNGNDAGHVRIYRYNTSTSLWVQLGTDIDGENAADRFGRSVALNENGNILVIGNAYMDDPNSGNNNNRGYTIVYHYVSGDWKLINSYGQLIYSNFTDLFTGVINFDFDINLNWGVFGDEFSLTFGLYRIEYKHFGGISGGSFTFYDSNTMIHSEATGIPNNGVGDVVRLEIIYDVEQKVFTIQSRGVVLLTYIYSTLTNTPTEEQIRTMIISGSTGVKLYDINVKNDKFYTRVEIDTGVDIVGETALTFKDTGSGTQRGVIAGVDDDSLVILAPQGLNILAETKIEKANIGYSDVSENKYITRLGNNSTLLKSPTEVGSVNYTNDILTLGGVPSGRIYGPSNGYYIGEKLAISNDGNIVATIAQIANNTAENETRNGACHIYQIVNGVYTQLGQVLYGDDSYDELQRVSLSSDGLTVAVGSFLNNVDTGNVRVYRYNQNTSLWVVLGGEIVGESVGDQFGSSISLSSDGNIIIIGANKADPNGISSGHARVFQYSTGWVQLGGTIEGPSADDNAGECVDINGAGNRIIVGMPFIDINGTDNVGTGKIYDLVNGQWVFNAQLDGTVFNTRLGLTVKMSEDGNTIAISTEEANNQAGYAEVYRNTNGVNWVQLGQRIVGEYSGDLMTKQNSMSLSKDGNTIALASFRNDNNGTDTGQVRVYRYNQNTSLWVQLGDELNGDNVGDQFGRSVALNENGNILVVGSPFADEITSSDNRGYIIVYHYVSGDWKLINSYGQLIYSNFTDLFTGIINFDFDINLNWGASGDDFSLTFGVYEIVYEHNGVSGGSFTIYESDTSIHSEATGIPNNGVGDVVKLEIIYDVSQKVFTIQSRGVVLITYTYSVLTNPPTEEQIRTMIISGSTSVKLYDINVKNDKFYTRVEIDTGGLDVVGETALIFNDSGSGTQRGAIAGLDDDSLGILAPQGLNILAGGDTVINSDLRLGTSNDLYSNNIYVSGRVIGGSLPIITRVRISKTPDRPPETGTAVYEDEYIRLGWVQETANELEIQRTAESSEFMATCYKSGTNTSTVKSVIDSNTTYTLNPFTFTGGEILLCRLSPFQNEVLPTYEISIHYTESRVGTDDKLDWLITRYNF